MNQNAGQVKVNCGCNQSYYAYVYPTRPYGIFVCRAFWNAGTVIHEMSPFNAVAGTDDHVYGQAGAKNLAITNPTRAGQRRQPQTLRRKHAVAELSHVPELSEAIAMQ